MKKVLLFLTVLINFTASAYEIIYVEPGDYWKAVIKNMNYQEGQICYVFLPGKGERVLPTNTAPLVGTKAATVKVINWMINSAGNLPAIADRDTVNIVAVAPRWEYESGEIQSAISYGRNVLKASKIIIISNSLGQYGLSIQCDKYPDLPKSFDGLISFVSGPGERTNTAKNIAAAKLPCWFFTAEDDKASGTTPGATINLHKNIVAKGGISWLTVLKSGQHAKIEYAHQIISQIVPASASLIGTKYPTTATPLNERGIVNIITLPIKNIFQWASSVNRSATLAPDYSALTPPKDTVVTTKPVDSVITKPANPIVNKPVTITGWNLSFGANRKLYLVAYWSDGTTTVASDQTGNVIMNIWIPVVLPGKERVSITYQDKTAQAIGPYK